MDISGVTSIPTDETECCDPTGKSHEDAFTVCENCGSPVLENNSWKCQKCGVIHKFGYLNSHDELHLR